MFTKKQIIRHQGRPEWGSGEIEQVQNVSVNGQSGQRLVIRFKHAGRKTLHTAFASMILESDWEATAGKAKPRMKSEDVNEDSLAEAVARQSGSRNELALETLPEALSDPFRSLEAKLKDTLSLYRFEHNARGLIDWACYQTGLEDPLQRWPRNMLEEGFVQFRRNLDAHLAGMIQEVRKTGNLGDFKGLRQMKIPRDAQKALARLR